MTSSITLKSIRKMAVIDDDSRVRASYSETLQDFGFEPVEIEGPLDDVSRLFDGPLKDCDAVMTDLVLRGGGYAMYDGGDIAVEGRRRRIPVLLCTAYDNVNLKLPRSQRRLVPAIFPKAEFGRSLLMSGIERCIAENDGRFSVERRPWRTQIEVVDIDEDCKYAWVIVMGRSADERTSIFMNELPEDIQIGLNKGRMLHAKVNVGAKSREELYFDDWEAA
jgi:hypothetical protein